MAGIEEVHESGLPSVSLDPPHVVVAAPDSLRLSRVAARDGFSEDEARRRLAAQVPLEEKVGRADWVIDNEGTREATRAQVERLWRTWHERKA